ncbi:MAG: polyprenyl synthetase family protein [Flavobacteriaceae bacterium]|nr:polyprenyl synthetase family protein [Flavobacteriaceae bacterium]
MISLYSHSHNLVFSQTLKHKPIRPLPDFFQSYINSFESHLARQEFIKNPKGLEIPIAYICKNGGKRIRPILVLLIAEMTKGKPAKSLDAALSVELFHNFTLIHDDLMDQSLLRRGQPTVHEKWDDNTAILAGDALLIMAYQQLKNYPTQLKVTMHELLSWVARIVCEGQREDIEFESKELISTHQYLEMITKKTAYLFACALKLGALVGGTTKKEANLFFDMGLLLGKLFQIQDDYLDAFGNTKIFGKNTGGDIRQGKKTILFTKTMELGSESQKNRLQTLFSRKNTSPSDRLVEEVLDLFTSTKADIHTRNLISSYLENMESQIDKLNISPDQKQKFSQLMSWISNRRN